MQFLLKTRKDGIGFIDTECFTGKECMIQCSDGDEIFFYTYNALDLQINS